MFIFNLYIKSSNEDWIPNSKIDMIVMTPKCKFFINLGFFFGIEFCGFLQCEHDEYFVQPTIDHNTILVWKWSW
jgi:hypothetical protein